MSHKKIGRREAIGVMSAASASLAFGCGSSPTEPDSGTATTTTPGGTNSACAVTPTETEGPFPSLTDLFRSDIREGKSGTLLTLTIKVVNTNAACAAVANANVEIWHVDSAGNDLAGRTVDRHFGVDVRGAALVPPRINRRKGHLAVAVRRLDSAKKSLCRLRSVLGVHADCFPRNREQHGALQRRLRDARRQPDLERVGRYFR
jgi:hypothetical protein